MASQSSGVSVVTLPTPKLMPLLVAVPGMTSTTLAPMLEIAFWTAAEEPAPISIMAITAATPITMPSVVKSARIGLRRSAFIAVVAWTGSGLLGIHKLLNPMLGWERWETYTVVIPVLLLVWGPKYASAAELKPQTVAAFDR